ncbi:MAG: D-amino acid dehydrogenase [Pseudomonadota bacterium]
MKVIVLGAGVIGISSAWYLARLGHEVVVVDRQSTAGMETSFANGGQVSVSQSEPWAAPSAPFKVLKWLFKEDAPLLFRPQFDWHQLSWGLEFLVECLPSRYRFNIQQMVNLGLYSRESLQTLREETNIEYDHAARGVLQFYTEAADYAGAEDACALLSKYGIARKIISREEAITIEPALKSLEGRLKGASYAESDESGDACKFTQNLAKLCESAGVKFLYDTAIEAIRTDGNRISSVVVKRKEAITYDAMSADAYVVCLGSYSTLMLRTIGISIPVYPAKGYSATLSTVGFAGAPQVSLTDEAMKIVFTRIGDRLRIAGTAEMAGYNTDINMVRCEALIKRSRDLFPNAADYDHPQYWTGLRPSTPSNRPIIGRAHFGNLFLNTGHGTLGWTEGPGSGRALADLVSGKVPEVDYKFLHVDGHKPR